MSRILKKIGHLYSYIRILSFDIVFGALCGAFFASLIFNLSPSVYFYITLASAVWVIYTLDHILDGKRMNENPEKSSDTLHHRYRNIFIFLILIISALNLYLVINFLEKEYLFFGFSTLALVMFYLLLNYISRKHKRYFPKEFIIAALYTWGIFGGFLFLKGTITNLQILIMVNYLLLVLINVLLFSLIEVEKDKANLFHSFATYFGISKTKKLIFLLLIAAGIFNLINIVFNSVWIAPSILLTMNFSLFVLTQTANTEKIGSITGILTDAVFFLPSILVLI